MMLLERIESLFRDNEDKIIEFYKISLRAIKQLSYKGQAMTLEFASKMINHVQEAKQQQVELVSIALDTNLIFQGSASNGKIGRKAVSLFKKLFLVEWNDRKES